MANNKRKEGTFKPMLKSNFTDEHRRNLGKIRYSKRKDDDSEFSRMNVIGMKVAPEQGWLELSISIENSYENTPFARK